ncbi:hypothetical protein, partial [Paenibacillus zanthoxyli]|uniref:hypothetical protein n=1 Tax=Paenibacillus zanthoxyli TaxID=369399 RepID=UPI001E28D63D
FTTTILEGALGQTIGKEESAGDARKHLASNHLPYALQRRPYEELRPDYLNHFRSQNERKQSQMIKQLVASGFVVTKVCPPYFYTNFHPRTANG